MGSPADHQRFAFRRLFSEVRVDVVLPDARRIAAAFKPGVVVHEYADFVGPLVAALQDVPSVTVGVGLVMTEECRDLVTEGVSSAWEQAGLDFDADGDLHRNLFLNPWPVPLQRPEVADLPFVRDLRPISVGIDSALPHDLVHLGRERPLVYVTFGTLFAAPEMIATVLDGLIDFDVDVLATTGPDTAPEAVEHSNSRAHVRRFVAQAPVLSRASLMVTHGGSGSVGGGLAAGAPLLVIPVGADQAENAARVAEIGVGRRLDPSMVTPDSVREQVASLLVDADTRGAAERIQEAIAAMPSPLDVVPEIEALVT